MVGFLVASRWTVRMHPGALGGVKQGWVRGWRCTPPSYMRYPSSVDPLDPASLIIILKRPPPPSHLQAPSTG